MNSACVYSQTMSKVGPYICWDEVVNAATGDEDLDNILDILDFPIESLEGEEFVGDWDVSNSDYLGPIPSDVLIHPPTIACSKADTGPRNLMPTPVCIIYVIFLLLNIM